MHGLLSVCLRLYLRIDRPDEFVHPLILGSVSFVSVNVAVVNEHLGSQAPPALENNRYVRACTMRLTAVG